MTMLASFSRPVQVAGLSLRSRWVMAPMASKPHGNHQVNRDYYLDRALKLVGLIITGGIVVDHPLSGYNEHPDYPRFCEAHQERLTKIISAVHGAGGCIAAQVWHLGGQVPNGLAASVRVKDGIHTASEASDAQLAELVEVFARAAAMARQVGFDAIELHGAHGYLLDGFFRRYSAHTGGISAASGFATQLIRAVREAVGADFPIGLRFSQWHVDDYEGRYLHSPGEMERFLAPLLDAGIDLFHASTRRFWLPAFDGSPLTFAGWTRKISGKPVIAVGGFGSDHVGGPDAMETFRMAARLLEAGELDLMALGRALLHDPAYCEKARLGQLDQMKVPA
jgi:2,4-dienoyl-CoA reductase-like NADH-dependent reductase (Old Yellow Enzyme family)